MLLLGLLPAPCSASFLTLPEPLLQGSTAYSGLGPAHQTLIEKMAPRRAQRPILWKQFLS